MPLASFGTGVVGGQRGGYYVSQYIGAGTAEDPLRPIGSEQPGWSAIDLRPDASRLDGGGLNACLLYLPEPMNDARLYLCGYDSQEVLGSAVRARLASLLGATLTESSFHRVCGELMMTPPANAWKALRPTHRGLYEVWLGGRLMWSQPRLAGGSSIADTFNRVDANLDGSTSSDGQFTWAESEGTGWSIVTNRAELAANQDQDAARAQADLATDDHYSELAVVSLGAGGNIQGGPTCRHSTTALTYYLHRAILTTTLNDHRLTKNVIGTLTDLGTDATDFAANEVLRVTANGSTITAVRDGVTLLTSTDTSIVGNLRCGLWGFTTGAGLLVQLDSFAAADLPVLTRTSRAIYRGLQRGVLQGVG